MSEAAAWRPGLLSIVALRLASVAPEVAQAAEDLCFPLRLPAAMACLPAADSKTYPKNYHHHHPSTEDPKVARPFRIHIYRNDVRQNAAGRSHSMGPFSWRGRRLERELHRREI